MSRYFPEPKSVGTNIKVQLDLSNYATDVKNATGVDISSFAKKTDFLTWKSDGYKLDITW